MIDPQKFRPVPDRQRPWQFSLFGLLVITTLVAAACAYGTHRYRREQLWKQRQGEFDVALRAFDFDKARKIAKQTNEEFPGEFLADLMLPEVELREGLASAVVDAITNGKATIKVGPISLNSKSGKLQTNGSLQISAQITTTAPPGSRPATLAAGSAADGRLGQITVPAGFEVSLAAAAPVVERPIMAGFDDRGRLYVAESAGLNLPRVELEKQLPNSIVLVTDTDGDGVFDKRTVFADKLTFPQGALWHDGWLYVASSGGIWRFRDINGDDVADERQMIVGNFGYTGNAADVHGCFLGPEGRIYWCEGRHGHEIKNAAGELVSKGKAARIFSCEPDGSDVRIHCGGGMDNPTEIDWTGAGEMLGTVNILYHQRGDCLVHWLHGGVYPRHDQPAMLAEFRRTGEPLDAVHNFGHVAVSGLCRYRPFGDKNQGFGRDWNDHWFVTEFNTHQVKHVQLHREGSSFRAEVNDFFKSTNGDSHPTDVLQDADGSLLVVDTGGWFRSGCPTSQIAKPDVLGAIYRVRRTDAAKVKDPWGQKIAWNSASADDLIKRLGDDRPKVRERAVARLVHAKDAAVPHLARVLGLSISGLNASRRQHAAEALTKIGSPAAIAVLQGETESSDSAVQQLAAFGLGAQAARHDEAAVAKSVSVLLPLLAEDVPHEVKLAAATALGRLGDSAAVAEILTALARPADRSLEHALIYALIETDDPAETRAALAHSSPLVKRAGLIALDQMPSGNLRREDVAALLATSDVPLQTAALEVLSRRKGWTDELVTSVEQLLSQSELNDSQRALVLSSLAAFAKQSAVQKLIATRLASEQTPPATMHLLLEAIAQAQLSPLPEAYRSPLRAALQKPALALSAIAAVNGSPREFDSELRELADTESQANEVRLAALATVTKGQPVTAPRFAWLVTQLAADNSPAPRMSAARTLGNAQLARDQQMKLTESLATAGPLEIGSLLAVFERAGDAELGAKLAEALQRAPGNEGLTLGQLNAVVTHYPDSTRESLQPLFARLQKAGEARREKLEELTATLPAGDASAGKLAFFNRQAGCFLCHRVGKEGGQVGPDLSTIGQRRNTRDLLEAIVFPSSSLARGYESHSLQLTDGRTLSGLIVRETAEAVVLRAADQSETRIPHASIETMQPTGISIMPAGLDKTMSRAQLADLVAFLKGLGTGG